MYSLAQSVKKKKRKKKSQAKNKTSQEIDNGDKFKAPHNNCNNAKTTRTMCMQRYIHSENSGSWIHRITPLSNCNGTVLIGCMFYDDIDCQWLGQSL